MALISLTRISCFARSEAVKFLRNSSPSQPVALYTMDDIGFHVLVEMTEDHALLAAKLQSWMPTAAAVSRAQEAETSETTSTSIP